MTNQKPDISILRSLVESESIEELSTDQILSSFSNDKTLNPCLSSTCQVDPRNDEPILFNSTRAVRPNDYLPGGTGPSNTCPICSGKTTGILDWKALSTGVTFINKNLYPVLSIAADEFDNLEKPSGDFGCKPTWGLHFVQWSSSDHDRDWHNLPLDDCVTVLSRLSALEKKLVQVGKELMQRSGEEANNLGNKWSVSIFKNIGAAVGGSLAHGHQQVVLHNQLPRKISDDLRFQEWHGKTFSDFLMAENPSSLTLRDYGPAILLVPAIMRRPFDMTLALKDTRKAYLHELDQDELTAVASGWKHASRVFHDVMPALEREIAYNIITHNGPGAGLYFEFLPFTQEQGGLEHLGLSVCQADPQDIADQIRSLLSTME